MLRASHDYRYTKTAMTEIRQIITSTVPALCNENVKIYHVCYISGGKTHSKSGKAWRGKTSKRTHEGVGSAPTRHQLSLGSPIKVGIIGTRPTKDIGLLNTTAGPGFRWDRWPFTPHGPLCITFKCPHFWQVIGWSSLIWVLVLRSNEHNMNCQRLSGTGPKTVTKTVSRITRMGQKNIMFFFLETATFGSHLILNIGQFGRAGILLFVCNVRRSSIFDSK